MFRTNMKENIRLRGDHLNLFSIIKAAVTTRQAAEHYGLQVSTSGMTCCPFHEDKHPSMKVDARYYCFGCHETGDVINFTAGLFHTSQYEAARKLADDFHIDISMCDHPPGKKSKSRSVPFKPDLEGLSAKLAEIQANAVKKERESWFKEANTILAQYRLLLYDWQEQFAPQNEDEEWHPLFIESCTQIEYVDYLFSMIDDPLEHDYFYENYKGEMKRIHERISEYQSSTRGSACA